MKDATAIGWKVPLIIGGAVTAASLTGSMLIFVTRQGSSLFLFSAGLHMFFFPGMYLAAAVLQEPHGPSIVGMLLVGVPLNVLFYAVAYYGVARMLRM